MGNDKTCGGLSVHRAARKDQLPWDSYVFRHKDGLAYHLFAWKQAVEESYGFICPYFYAKKNGVIRGVIPLVHLRPPIGRGVLVSLPYCDVGGILADSKEIADALFAHVCQYARTHGISSIEIRCSQHPCNREKLIGAGNLNGIKDAFFSPGSADPIGKVRMLLNLPDNSEALMASFKSKLRSQVRKPLRDGLYFRLGGEELLDVFFSVFAKNMADLGSPVHSRKWLSNVLQKYGNLARCGVVYMPDRSAAAVGIILLRAPVVSIPWASSLRRFNRYNPNMLLYWSFMAYAADNGFRFFDFGRSTPGEGTYHFKAQWGARSLPLSWTKWKVGKKSADPFDSDTVEKFEGLGRTLAEHLFRKLPLSVSISLGSRVRKYISL